MVNLSLISAGKTGSVVKLTCANTSMVSINFLTVHCDVWYKLGKWRKVVKWKKTHMPTKERKLSLLQSKTEADEVM